MARKGAVRTIITLVCTECSARVYHSEKNRRNNPERLELNKYCGKCRGPRPFREKR